MKFYDQSGKDTDVELKALMKERNNVFHARQYRGFLFDPYGIDERKAKDATWVKVSSNCAEFYLKYLKTKQQQFLRRAEREFINV